MKKRGYTRLAAWTTTLAFLLSASGGVPRASAAGEETADPAPSTQPIDCAFPFEEYENGEAIGDVHTLAAGETGWASHITTITPDMSYTNVDAYVEEDTPAGTVTVVKNDAEEYIEIKGTPLLADMWNTGMDANNVTLAFGLRLGQPLTTGTYILSFDLYRDAPQLPNATKPGHFRMGASTAGDLSASRTTYFGAYQRFQDMRDSQYAGRAHHVWPAGVNASLPLDFSAMPWAELRDPANPDKGGDYLLPKTWYHYRIEFDLDNGTFRVYINDYLMQRTVDGVTTTDFTGYQEIESILFSNHALGPYWTEARVKNIRFRQGGLFLPMPALADTPQLSYEYAMPADSPAAPGDLFEAEGNLQPIQGAPVLSSVTAQAGPGNAFVIQGTDFLQGVSAPKVWVYAQTDGTDGQLYEAEVLQSSNTTVTAVLDEGTAYGMYLVWVENGIGTSYPLRVNGARADWLGQTSAKSGDVVSVYGSNLTHENGETAYVYIRSGGASASSVSAQVVEANPYKVSFILPEIGAASDNCEVWVHNGHGGQYGWSGPLFLTVRETDLYAFGGTVHDVTDYGADPLDPSNDDTSAVSRAITAAQSGDTIYFPAGTYTLSDRLYITTKSLYFRGESAQTTTIRTATGFTNKNSSLFYITSFPSRFSDLTFLDDKEAGGRPYFIQARGDDYAQKPEGMRIENCRFQQAVRGARDETLSEMLMLSGIAGGSLSGCHFLVPRGVVMNNCDRFTIRDNVGYGNCILDDQSGPLLFKFNSCSQIDLHGNGIYAAQSLIDTEDTLEVGDQSFGRGIVFQSPYGPCRDLYIAENDVNRVGTPVDNSGEVIMLEAPHKLYDGTPVQVNGTQMIFDNPGWTDAVQNGTVCIVNGTGQAQSRRVAAVDGGTLTVDRPWDIPPDTTSRILIVAPFENVAIYNNTIHGFSNFIDAPNASAGIQAYGNMINFWVTDNCFSDLMTGVRCSVHVTNPAQETANSLYNLSLGTIIARNRIDRVRDGVMQILAYKGNAGSGTLPMHMSYHTVIRENVISRVQLSDHYLITGIGGDGITVGSEYRDYTTWAPNNTWPGSWVVNTVVENNRITDAQQAYVRLQSHQGDTVVRGNLFDGVSSEEEAVLLDPNASAALLQDNTCLPYERNIVQNSGFEQGLSGWSAVDGAAQPIDPASSSFSPLLGADDAYEGEASLLCDGSHPGTALVQTLSVRPQTTYTADFFAWMTTAAAQDGCELTVSSPSGDVLGRAQADSSLTGQWQQLSLSFQSGENTSVLVTIRDGGFTGRVDHLAVRAVRIIPPDDDNLVQNPGFEEGFASWQGTNGSRQPVAWENTVFSLTQTDPHSGQSALYCAGTGGWTGFAQTVEVEPNRDYVLFFYSNITSRTSASGSCQIKVVGETGAYLKAGQAAQTANPSLMNQWYLNTYSFHSGDSTRVQIWIQDGGFTGSFDDFRIEPIG